MSGQDMSLWFTSSKSTSPRQLTNPSSSAQSQPSRLETLTIYISYSTPFTPRHNGLTNCLLIGTVFLPRSSITLLTSSMQVASQALRPRRNPLLSSRFAALQKSFLSTETRAAIDKAVGTAPVVLFMKGTPETPQCGFSRASIQILGLQGVNPQKFTAFNVLEDEELRAGMFVDMGGDHGSLESGYVGAAEEQGC